MSKLKFLNLVFILVCCLVYTSHCLARDYTDFEREYYIENIKKYTEEIKQNPNEALLYGARGEAYYELGAYEQAIDDFTKSIALIIIIFRQVLRMFIEPRLINTLKK